MSAKDDYEFSTELDISSRKQDINQIKVLSTEIVETGLNVIFIYNLNTISLYEMIFTKFSYLIFWRRKNC
jgi:hypothetical protein